MSRKWTNNDGMKFDTEKDMDDYEAARVYNRERILKDTGGKYISFGAKRRAKTDSQKFIIDKILPEGELHLLAGTSGVGKSTLLLPVLKAIQEGKPVWGLDTVATPLVYIMCDSSSTSLERKLRRVGLTGWDIPAYAIEDLREKPFDFIFSENQIWDLPDIFPWAKLFVIEAYGWFYSEKSSNGSKDYTDMIRFWSRVRAKFSSTNLTIWGTTHIPKLKRNEGYDNTRDKVFGSVAQSAVSSTVMTLEKHLEDDSKRILRLSPRDSKEFQIEFGVDGNGVLQYLGNVGEKERQQEIREQTSKRMFDSKLASYSDGDLLHASTIKDWCLSMNFAEATAYRWVESRLKDRTLTRVDKGVYRVNVTTEQ